MKKIFLFINVFLISNLLFAQESVTITGSSSVEVGVPNNYTLKFTPQYPTNTVSYEIQSWEVATQNNCNYSQIGGYIGTTSNHNCFYIANTSENNFTVPIQWGDKTATPYTYTDDKITVKVSGVYIGQNNENTGYFNFITSTKSVRVEKLVAPIISGVSTVLGCNQTNTTFNISNETNGNQFFWTTTDGATIEGSNTGTSVLVKPPLIGNFYVKCLVKRSGANSNYSVDGIKLITRSLFTTSATIIGSETICNSASYSVSGIENGLTVSSWSVSNTNIASLNNTTGNSVTLTKLNRGEVILNATIKNSCDETISISKRIILGSPMPLIDGNSYCPTESAPCALNATANNNYLILSLSAPLGNYTPLSSDWEWEKISGNFYFLKDGLYNSLTAIGRQGNIYLNGNNPIDNPLKFKCRVKNACGWGDWRYYVWNDGTTTPLTPPILPEKYYKIAPNPSGGYAANISLLNSAIAPTTSNPIIVKLFTVYGQELSTTQLYNNSGMVYIYSFPYNVMYIRITFDNHMETHTVLKY